MHPLPIRGLFYRWGVDLATGFCPYNLLHGVQPTIPPAIKPRFESHLDLDSEAAAAESLVVRGEAMRRNMAIAGDYVYYRNASARTAPEPKAQPHILRVVEFQGAKVVRIEHRPGDPQDTHTGVATYAGRQGRRYLFEVLYDDGTLELVDLAKLRTMLAPKAAARPRRTARVAAASSGSAKLEDWSVNSPAELAAALSVAMPGVHDEEKVALLARSLDEPLRRSEVA
ncbi:hypothetical protein GPECTOR_3g454 [Gonium pectorale]|uniref:Uncharacterized protein n=1 Tax=Gonium pectorale TaxID=33097 RepID=A0A150GZP8_GONPE|nr:hypothetical protein GPECTOR_3g454 [Gonium pectorale]|eukprot:KXZ55321.1 hypothetical protein GPECTOR_3g454 [Gonium pectorale]